MWHHLNLGEYKRYLLVQTTFQISAYNMDLGKTMATYNLFYWSDQNILHFVKFCNILI